MSEFIILAIPFIGTSLGSAMVFFLKKRIAPKFEKMLLGFAAGVMIAASVWSLLIPSIDMSKGSSAPEWLAALVGFLAGIFFLLLLDTVIPHMHIESRNQEGIRTNSISKTTMMLFAVTLHNIPEGMSVGVAFAGAMMKDSGITATAAMALAIGIAIQNFPEGAIISLPLHAGGASRKKSCFLGIMSGVVEPIGAVLTVIFAGIAVPLLPYLLSFAAGAMIYVVTEELIPESQNGKHSNIGTIGVAIGFTLMMVLDVALG
mgnify:FL=1